MRPTVTEFSVVPMQEEHGPIICSWRYEPPYDIYNWNCWDKMNATQTDFADPSIREKQYVVVLDQQAELAGFAQFFPLVGVTRIGLGMRPDLCGQGKGAAFVEAIVREAVRRNSDDEIDLEVLVWNDRARKAYEKAGFRKTEIYERMTPTGPDRFHCMVWDGPGEY